MLRTQFGYARRFCDRLNILFCFIDKCYKNKSVKIMLGLIKFCENYILLIYILPEHSPSETDKIIEKSVQKFSILICQQKKIKFHKYYPTDCKHKGTKGPLQTLYPHNLTVQRPLNYPKCTKEGNGNLYTYL